MRKQIIYTLTAVMMAIFIGTAAPNTAQTGMTKAYGAEVQKVTATSEKASKVKLKEPKITRALSRAVGAKLGWKSVSGAEKYNVYRRKAGTSVWKKIKTTSKTKFTDKTGIENVSYEYTVSAVSGNCESKYAVYSKYAARTSDRAFQKATLIVNSICKTSMSNVERLETSYYWLKRCSYTHGTIPGSGSTSWISDYAYNIYTQHRGNCYQFASGVAYFARVLGFKCNITGGWLGGTVAHAWNELKIGKKTYVCDAQLQFTHARSRGCDHHLFKTTYSDYNCDGMRLTPVRRFSLSFD